MSEQTKQTEQVTEISQYTKEFANWVKESAEKTQNFLEGEIPIVIQEYLTWIFWDNISTVLIWLFFFIIATVVQVYNLKASKKNIEDSNNHATSFWDHYNSDSLQILQILLFISYFGLMMSFFIGVVPSVKNCIKVKVAPRIILIEKASDLAR